MNNKVHQIAYTFAIISGVSFVMGIVILSRN